MHIEIWNRGLTSRIFEPNFPTIDTWKLDRISSRGSRTKFVRKRSRRDCDVLFSERQRVGVENQGMLERNTEKKLKNRIVPNSRQWVEREDLKLTQWFILQTLVQFAASEPVAPTLTDWILVTILARFNWLRTWVGASARLESWRSLQTVNWYKTGKRTPSHFSVVLGIRLARRLAAFPVSPCDSLLFDVLFYSRFWISQHSSSMNECGFRRRSTLA